MQQQTKNNKPKNKNKKNQKTENEKQKPKKHDVEISSILTVYRRIQYHVIVYYLVGTFHEPTR